MAMNTEQNDPNAETQETMQSSSEVEQPKETKKTSRKPRKQEKPTSESRKAAGLRFIASAMLEPLEVIEFENRFPHLSLADLHKFQEAYLFLYAKLGVMDDAILDDLERVESPDSDAAKAVVDRLAADVLEPPQQETFHSIYG